MVTAKRCTGRLSTRVRPRITTRAAAVCLWVLIFSWSAPVAGQVNVAPFPLVEGEAVATCFSGLKVPRDPSQGIELDRFVVGVVDVRTPVASGAEPGEHWSAPMYHNEKVRSPTGKSENEWTAAALGQVFGIALDDDSKPSIFVAASSTYFPVFEPDGHFAPGNFGPLGSGGIYRLDGRTGAICQHAQLNVRKEDPNDPNSKLVPAEGPALGNITYDRVNRQLFVSNFENGEIVRLPSSTPCNVLVSPLSVFDHGMEGRPTEGLTPIPDDGEVFARSEDALDLLMSCSPIPSSGFTPLGRRVWAVQVHDGRLYYSVWNEDEGKNRGGPDKRNEIWSVGILPGGDFDRQDVRREEVEVPPLTGRDHSNPISDIAFSADGRMLLAERVRCRDHGAPLINAHGARVLEYERKASGLYGSLIRRVPVGIFHDLDYEDGQQNSAGGIDYGYDVSAGDACDETVWATGDALRLQASSKPRGVYGLQGTPDGAYSSEGEALDASFFIDLDGAFSTLDKTAIGDVEVVREECVDPPCLDEITFDSLCLVEGGSATGEFVWRFRIRNESGGTIHHMFLNDLPPGVSADPEHIVFDPPVPNNQFSQKIYTVKLTGMTPGTVLQLELSIHDDQLVECCAETVTVELPECECAQIVSEQRPACFVPPFHAPPPYRYRVDLQNLSGRTAQYFLTAAVDPSDLSTPILPEDLRVRGSGKLTKPAVSGETTGSFNFLIDGPGAQPGREVCLLLSLNDEDFRECCSIPRCFTLPDCTIPDDPIVGVGGTVLDFDRGELVLSGFGDGVGGIDVEIPGKDVFGTTWAPIALEDGQGAEIRVTTFSLEEEELATAHAREVGGQVEIRAAFEQQRDDIVIEVLDENGSVVSSQLGRSDRVAATLDGWPAGFVMVENLEGIIILGHEDTYSVRLPDGTELEDVVVRIRDANESADIPLGRGALRVEGLEELRLRTLLAIADCDGDGIPDAEAIAQELVEDANGDGVPDSCEGEAPAVLVRKPAVMEP